MAVSNVRSEICWGVIERGGSLMPGVGSLFRNNLATANESHADRGLSFAAMAGAVVGATAGVALEVDLGSDAPMFFGTLGAMVGSALVVGVWWATVNAVTALIDKRQPWEPADTDTLSEPVNR